MPPSFESAPALGLACALLLIAGSLAYRDVLAARRLQIAWRLQREGDPRRSLAVTRIAVRRCPRRRRFGLLVCQANAFLWDGQFDRAIALVDQQLLPARHSTMVPLIIELQALAFAGRTDDARRLYDAHAAALHGSKDGPADVLAIEGFLAFHSGDLVAARSRLAEALTRAAPGDPISSGVHYFLAAIAHRCGEREQARHLLERTIREGGRRFTTAWARQDHAETFPESPVPECGPRAPLAKQRRGTSVLRRAGMAIVLLLAAVIVVLSIVGGLLAWHDARGDASNDGVARAATTHDSETRERLLDDNAHDNELAFMQAERVLTAERSLARGRPNIVDLYFVGGAGYAEQDVFLREASSARTLFDERFGTAERSLLFANHSADRELPALANVSLRHALRSVGSAMNSQEDVLFLFVTSHGSRSGLALDFGPRSGFRNEILRPAGLRSMLDEAAILWRVIVVAGCESGAFIAPLAEPHTLVVTAASHDRPSYGCADGNPYTEFGRALFAEELPRNPSFVSAFGNAVAIVTAREADAGILASRPQLAVGGLIGGKLKELEAGFESSAPPKH